MKTYRTQFWAALIGNVVMAGLLATLWFHYRSPKVSPNREMNPVNVSAQESGGMVESATQTDSPLVPVQISPQRLQSIGVKFAEVQRKVVANEINTTGSIAMDETRLAYVQVRLPGYVQKVFADATYQYVHKGQALCTIYSPDLVATEREYLAARLNQQQVAHSTVSGVTSSAASLLDAATERLRQWGVSEKEIARLQSTGQVQQGLEIDSPISGYITERNALPSVAVQPEMRLYTIADLSTIWVQAQVFQNDLGQIKPGAPATLTVSTYPGRTFTGRVDFIYPQVDMDTRTAKVRIVSPNPGLLLKPGMFVNVSVKVAMGRQLVIPATGVLQSGSRALVFVQRRDGYIEPRDVNLGARVGDDFIVLRGLKAGEQIASSANFLIDSESELQAAAGAFVSPVPVTGAAAASGVSAQFTAELTTDPTPPHKGANTVRLRLTSSDGKPIAGARVAVTFYMEAMPAMGMAALKTVITAVDKGGGMYEGTGDLGSAGTWQVTIVAMQNGQVILSKQTNLSATGGM